MQIPLDDEYHRTQFEIILMKKIEDKLGSLPDKSYLFICIIHSLVEFRRDVDHDETCKRHSFSAT